MLGIYLTTGHPDLETSKKALRFLDDAGVELIELGVPFSDPLADGPVIQKSSFEALENGINLDKIFSLISELRAEGVKSEEKKGLNNLILFSYFNPLYNYGFDELIARCKETGVRGVLIPDLPVEEAEDLCAKFKEADLDLILLVAVTSNDERIEKIAELSNPWIYLVSRTGVTGSKDDIAKLKSESLSDDLDTRLKEIIQKIKAKNDKKVALGFGIDSRKKVENAFKLGADMAIIGTKAVACLGTEGLDGFKSFITNLQAESQIPN